MLIQILFNSLVSAILLSLVALGFNLIFNATKVFHLAHGAFYVMAIYIYYWSDEFFEHNLPPVIAAITSVAICIVLISAAIVLVEYLVYRPLFKKNVNPTISLISSLGIYLLIINLITFFNGSESISINNSYRIVLSDNYLRITNVELRQLIMAVMLICGVGLFSKTKYYINIRAIADSYSVAEKFGIHVQHTRLIALITGTVLVGISGILKAQEVSIDPNVGLSLVLTSAVAVIFGGTNSLSGTVIACFIIALIENYSVKFISAVWTDTLTYALLIVVLIFNKTGIITSKLRAEAR